MGILITDGHATTSQGRILDDTGVLIDKSQQLANLGIILNTVGLGNANNFNTALLTDLSDKGRGSFIFADTPASLEPQLQKRLTECQAMATENTVIQLIPSNGVKVKGFCRYRPEYLPLEETAKNQLTIGAIAANSPTDLLIELEIPLGGFDEPTGNKDVISVELTAKGMTNPVRAKAGINYTTSYPELQKQNKVNEEIKKDYYCWMINLTIKELSGTENPNEQKELLEKARYDAEEAGKTDMVNQLDQELDDLEKSGKLDPNRTTKLLRDSRANQKFPLNQIRAIIGRSDAPMSIADIDLTECKIDNKSAISRHHAVIEWVEGKLQIIDLDSTNGTFVNGKKLLTTAP
ncbi:MAG: FHA domain-containing protein, partial [Oscillatoriales cyanobacterium]